MTKKDFLDKIRKRTKFVRKFNPSIFEIGLL
jgi:hypothetical protein